MMCQSTGWKNWFLLILLKSSLILVTESLCEPSKPKVILQAISCSKPVEGRSANSQVSKTAFRFSRDSNSMWKDSKSLTAMWSHADCIFPHPSHSNKVTLRIRCVRPRCCGQFHLLAQKNELMVLFWAKMGQIRPNTNQSVSPLNRGAPNQDSAGHIAALLQCTEHSWRFRPFGFGQSYTPPRLVPTEKRCPAPAVPSLAGHDW